MVKLWPVSVSLSEFCLSVVAAVHCEQLTRLSSSGLRTAGGEAAEGTWSDCQPLVSPELGVPLANGSVNLQHKDLWHHLQQLQFQDKGQPLAKPSSSSILRSLHVSGDSHFWSWEG